MKKKIMYIDMDCVVDIVSDNEACDIKELRLYKDLQPIKDVIRVVNKLANTFDVYFLITIPYTDKINWIKKYFPKLAKKMITSKYKHLNSNAYLIYNRTKNNTSDFKGEFIQFGSRYFKNWNIIEQKLLDEFDNILFNITIVNNELIINYLNKNNQYLSISLDYLNNNKNNKNIIYDLLKWNMNKHQAKYINDLIYNEGVI